MIMHMKKISLLYIGIIVAFALLPMGASGTEILVTGGNGGSGGLSGSSGGSGGNGNNGGNDFPYMGQGSRYGGDGGKPGEGGKGGSDYGGGGGGGASLDMTGSTVTATKVTVESGKKGGLGIGGGGGGGGGDAEFKAGTLKATTITLIENDGDLTFNVGTLDVTTGHTTLNLVKTGTGEVTFETVELGNGKTFKVTSKDDGGATIETFSVSGSGRLELDNTGADVIFTDIELNGNTLTVASQNGGTAAVGTLDATGATIIFDLNGVKVNSDAVLNANGADVSLGQVKIKLDNAILRQLPHGTTFVLISNTGLDAEDYGTQTGSTIGYNIYSFNFKVNDDGDLIVVIVIEKLAPKNQTSKGPGTFLSQINNPLDAIINPTILGITNNEEEMELSIIATTEGHETVHKYQWQMVDENGNWINIEGATSATYNYGNLSPGNYGFRCIVWNGTGGQATSEEIPIEIVSKK